MKKIKIIETAFRDAHQSLLATRMRTRDMLPIAEKMDNVGFFNEVSNNVIGVVFVSNEILSS